MVIRLPLRVDEKSASNTCLGVLIGSLFEISGVVRRPERTGKPLGEARRSVETLAWLRLLFVRRRLPTEGGETKSVGLRTAGDDGFRSVIDEFVE